MSISGLADSLREMDAFVMQELLEKNKMFSYTKTQCDVTNYADNFYEMTGRSPYANPAGNAN